MNKVLQGVLLLDTETSRELRKSGVANIVIDSKPITVLFDKEAKKVSWSIEDAQGEEKDFQIVHKDIIQLTEEDYKALENGEILPFGKKGTIRLNDNGTKIVYTPNKKLEINQVIYR